MGACFFKSKYEPVKSVAKSLWELSAEDISGKTVELKSLCAGKKCICVVNVASRCGFTKNHYNKFKVIYDEYKDKGFEIVAFPCTQFMNQESGSHDQIKNFVCEIFKCNFPLMAKVEVNGPNTHPVFAFLRKSSPLYDSSKDKAKQIPWNFTKFLCNEEGQVIQMFEPNKDPSEMVPLMKKTLGID